MARLLLILALLFAAGPDGSPAQNPAPLPNVLWILGEDLGPELDSLWTTWGLH